MIRGLKPICKNPLDFTVTITLRNGITDTITLRNGIVTVSVIPSVQIMTIIFLTRKIFKRND